MSITSKEKTKEESDRKHHQQRKASLDLALHKACKEGDVSVLDLLIKRGEDINAKDNFGNTPLHLACFHNKTECINKLIELKDIDLNCVDLFRRTPLFYCARNGNLECLQKLVKKGVDVSIKTDTGETPLSKAVYYNHVACVKFLIQSKSSLEDRERTYGNTPLHIAASKGHTDCLSCLIDAGADINSKNDTGFTALHLAVIYKHADCIKVLLSHNCQLETKNAYGKTPYEDATSKDIQSLLKKAMIAGQLEDMKKKDVTKWTNADVVRWLTLIGFSQYKESFIQNDISGRNLRALTANSLKSEMNIQSLGHRSLLLEAIKKLYRKVEDSPPRKASKGETDVESMAYEIDRSELKMCELLGKGFFGEVRRAIWNGTEVAVKEIYKSSFGKQSDLDVFYKELNILSKLRHPNVVMFIGACTITGNKCIVTEYLKGGSLHHLIHQSWDVLERNHLLRYRIVCDIIKGMTYLHEGHILHRDLTTKNILLDSNYNCRICDFGLSRIKEESREMTSGLGCLPYQAPEVFRGDKYGEPADVFSFAMVVYELVSGFEPHKGLDPLKYANMVAYEGYRPPLPKQCSVQWEKIIVSCWSQNFEQRPTFKKLLTDLQIVEPPTTAANSPSKFDQVMNQKAAAKNFDYQVGAYTE